MKQLAQDNKTAPANVEAAERTQRIKTAIASADAPYLRPDQAAQFLGISRRSLSNLQRRHAISYSKLGRIVVFKTSDIIAAVEKFRVKSVGEV